MLYIEMRLEQKKLQTVMLEMELSGHTIRTIIIVEIVLQYYVYQVCKPVSESMQT